LLSLQRRKSWLATRRVGWLRLVISLPLFLLLLQRFTFALRLFRSPFSQRPLGIVAGGPGLGIARSRFRLPRYFPVDSINVGLGIALGSLGTLQFSLRSL